MGLHKGTNNNEEINIVLTPREAVSLGVSEFYYPIHIIENDLKDIKILLDKLVYTENLNINKYKIEDNKILIPIKFIKDVKDRDIDKINLKYVNGRFFYYSNTNHYEQVVL